MKSKQLKRALEDLAEEGVTQVFRRVIGGDHIVGVVGELQLDVLKTRVETEYQVKIDLEPAPFETGAGSPPAARPSWKTSCRANRGGMSEDRDGSPVFLARNAWELGYVAERSPHRVRRHPRTFIVFGPPGFQPASRGVSRLEAGGPEEVYVTGLVTPDARSLASSSASAQAFRQHHLGCWPSVGAGLRSPACRRHAVGWPRSARACGRGADGRCRPRSRAPRDGGRTPPARRLDRRTRHMRLVQRRSTSSSSGPICPGADDVVDLPHVLGSRHRACIVGAGGEVGPSSRPHIDCQCRSAAVKIATVAVAARVGVVRGHGERGMAVAGPVGNVGVAVHHRAHGRGERRDGRFVHGDLDPLALSGALALDQRARMPAQR